MHIDSNIALGKAVKYFDYLGMKRYGSIVGIEPYHDDIAYIYIEDEEVEFNIHEHIINGKPFKYAEIRPSDEVYLDKD